MWQPGIVDGTFTVVWLSEGRGGGAQGGRSSSEGAGLAGEEPLFAPVMEDKTGTPRRGRRGRREGEGKEEERGEKGGGEGERGQERGGERGERGRVSV